MQRLRDIKGYDIRNKPIGESLLGRLVFKTTDIEEARSRIVGTDNIIHYVFDKKKQSV